MGHRIRTRKRGESRSPNEPRVLLKACSRGPNGSGGTASGSPVPSFGFGRQAKQGVSSEARTGCGDFWMNLVTRKSAKAQGLKRYFTGRPCKNGHVDERFTSVSTCLSCADMYERQKRPGYASGLQNFYAVVGKDNPLSPVDMQILAEIYSRNPVLGDIATIHVLRSSVVLLSAENEGLKRRLQSIQRFT
jgi:hypothetical protein